MPLRAVAFVLVFALAAAGLSVPPAVAADLEAERSETRRGLFKRCSYLDNIFLWGDPRDCPMDETVPACDAPKVVKEALRFTRLAEDAYRVPDVVSFVPVREVHDTIANPSPLMRRYCEGNVTLDNGDHATAYYFIEEDSHLVGLSWKVYVCISGYDRWRVYDGRCRVARPTPRY